MSASPAIPGSSVTPESPWLGLRSFTEEAQSFFFGRSAELDDLYERVLDRPLAILFGQSGLGKSSLLNAALVPRLAPKAFSQSSSASITIPAHPPSSLSSWVV